MNSPIRIALHNPALMNTFGEIEEISLKVQVRKRDVLVPITIGRLLFEGIECHHTMVIQSDYNEIVRDHARSLPGNSFGARLSNDYGAALQTAVHQLCNERGWVVTQEHGHWPVLHIIAASPQEKEPATSKSMWG